MGVIISLGAMTSFFALAMSCMNAGSRIMFSMARYGMFPISMGSSHKNNLTPHVALKVFAIIQFLIPSVFMLLSYAGCDVHDGISVPYDAFNSAGLFGAMGFSSAYVLISLATPFYLKKIGELRAWHIAMCVIAELLLIVPIVGLVWPMPPFPLNVQPYIFRAYMLVGVYLVMSRSRSIEEFDGIRKVLEESTVGPLASSSSSSPMLPPDAEAALA